MLTQYKWIQLFTQIYKIYDPYVTSCNPWVTSPKDIDKIKSTRFPKRKRKLISKKTQKKEKNKFVNNSRTTKKPPTLHVDRIPNI